MRFLSSGRCFKSVLLLAGVCCCLKIAAQPVQRGYRSNALGNANQYGYARIVRELGALPLGASGVPLYLVFTSDPNQRPGTLGPGWQLPLIDTRAYRSREGVLVWEGPDGYRRFFVYSKEVEVRRDEKGYHSQKRDWIAVEDGRSNTIRIHSVAEPEVYFDYREGRLRYLRLRPGSPELSVERSGRGELTAVREREGRKPLLELHYRGTRPEALRIGETELGIEMGKGDWLSPDGQTPYANYRMEYLRRIGEERFDYPADRKKIRLIGNRSQELSINRLEVSTVGGGKSWLSFEAQSGFIVADSGGSYTVENREYDPLVQEDDEKPRQPRVSPRLVRIERQPGGGQASQLWSRDWPSGVETYSKPDGSLHRKTWIMAQGPAFGLLCREESQKNQGPWELVQKLSYDPKGRKIRKLGPGTQTLWKWVDNGRRSVSEMIVDGQLMKEEVFEGGELKEKSLFRNNGDVLRYVYGQKSGLDTVAYYVNDKAVNYRVVDGSGQLNYMRWADGREQFWSKAEGVERLRTVYADGREQVMERPMGGNLFRSVRNNNK